MTTPVESPHAVNVVDSAHAVDSIGVIRAIERMGFTEVEGLRPSPVDGTELNP